MEETKKLTVKESENGMNEWIRDFKNGQEKDTKGSKQRVHFVKESRLDQELG